MKFKKWLDNFWYHYKWPVIIAAFFITISAVCISQMVSKEHYDMYIRYVGDQSITDTQYQDIKRAFQNFSYHIFCFFILIIYQFS